MNMNQFFPDWSSSMGDTFAPLGGEDDGLIELMWCNGHVVMQSQQQAPRKPPRPDKADDDAATAAAQAQAWFQYPVEDPLERDDLFSELFGEAQAAVDGAARAACCKEERGGDEAARQSISRMMPPPPRPAQAHAHTPREEKACPVPADGAAARTSAGCEAAATATEGGESSSMLTIGSSFCGSNHVQTPPPPRACGSVPARDAAAPPGAAKDVAARARDSATVTSSATRSRSCTTESEQPGPGAAAATAAAYRSGKRKQSDATDAEDVEFESADVTCEPAHKSKTAKRRRAAEVHNLSERRRRDRINEKMKALQELIPYCNKTDKASMLDEAIEYLKSLQLQLQMMWMGSGMAAAAPLVLPAGVHQYMQRMVAAGPPPHMSSMPGTMPFMAPPPAVQGAPPLHDPYAARYLAVDHHLPPPPPMVAPPPYTHCLQAAMGFYQRQNPALLPLPPPPVSPSNGILHKRYENCGKPEIQGMTG